MYLHTRTNTCVCLRQHGRSQRKGAASGERGSGLAETRLAAPGADCEQQLDRVVVGGSGRQCGWSLGGGRRHKGLARLGDFIRPVTK